MKKEEDGLVVYGGMIESVASRKDKSIKITIGANELTPDKMSDIMGLSGTFVYTAHKLETFVTSELNEINALKYVGKVIGKSMAETTRNLLYRLWEKNNCGFDEFMSYYTFRMTNIIDVLRDELSKLSV